MAIIKNGINGGFKGRVGNVVGYQLNGQWIIRSLPQVSEKMKVGTAKQQQHRKRFATLQAFLKMALPFVKIGFKETALKLNLNPHNIAVSRNMPWVNDLGQIEFDKLLLSEGLLPSAENQQVVLEENALRLTWNTATPSGLASADDLIMILAYNSANNYVHVDLAAAKRSVGHGILPIDGQMGDLVHVWTCFVSYPKEVCSESAYLGRVQF